MSDRRSPSSGLFGRPSPYRAFGRAGCPARRRRRLYEVNTSTPPLLYQRCAFCYPHGTMLPALLTTLLWSVSVVCATRFDPLPGQRGRQSEHDCVWRRHCSRSGRMDLVRDWRRGTVVFHLQRIRRFAWATWHCTRHYPAWGPGSRFCWHNVWPRLSAR